MLNQEFKLFFIWDYESGDLFMWGDTRKTAWFFHIRRNIKYRVQENAAQETEKDSLLRAIDASALDFDGLSSSDVYGLYDIKHVASAISTTGFVSTITENIYGFGIEGLVEGDFAIYNNTTSSAVTIATFAAVDNAYTFTFTAQTAADELKVSVSKGGYDDSLIEAELVTIP